MPKAICLSFKSSIDPVAAKITNSMTNNSMKLALAEGLKQSDFIHSKDHDEDHEHHSHHEESNQDPHVWLILF